MLAVLGTVWPTPADQGYFCSWSGSSNDEVKKARNGKCLLETRAKKKIAQKGLSRCMQGCSPRVDAHVPKEVPFDVEPEELEGASMLGTEGQEF